MKHQRNVDGLRKNAQKKKEKAIARTQQAIEQLIQEKRPINFKVVAETADVSTAWLYKEPDIKAQIEHLRDEGIRKQKLVLPQQKASDASKDAKYQALKQRLQKVEGENKELRTHLEVVHGRMRVISQENERLTNLLEDTKDPNLSTMPEIGIHESETGDADNSDFDNLEIAFLQLVTEVVEIKKNYTVLKEESVLLKEEITCLKSELAKLEQSCSMKPETYNRLIAILDEARASKW